MSRVSQSSSKAAIGQQQHLLKLMTLKTHTEPLRAILL